MFDDKVLLITGGTGSFGNAVLERLRKEQFAEIRIFSRDEKKQEDMRVALKDERLKFYIGDVRDPLFAKLFFGIWLSPQTSEPQLRRALLAQEKSQAPAAAAP